ncbi:amino acid/amide ABC transporter substrate-binding protein (HAAT family) [Microterricola gilva]|uniref:Amino acid/amide ABC transporter substrate-binding protein (HAAT family) n=1 Tax=Microterricola gilva TaxID=393267 RepID=A0A4Q8APW7_9MICO|nr:ABC transporter substrate-binding protein [Microterricola gilva]RZU66231.1 amino acid/amide ABC transporter substrate-binding protein (HAAT family) [Microterricola gilva]
MKRHLVGTVAIAAATLLVLSGCAGGDSAGGEGAPIKIGSVNTISGPATFPEASKAAAAVFDAVNADGGVNGHKIEYKALDDKGDPATATASARELVGSDEVVALVGGASLLECEINQGYYTQESILSIPGIGVDTGCFNTPNIAPANVGPFNDMTLTLLYGSETLKLDNICVLLEIAGSTRPTYQAAIDRWTEITGKKPLYIDDTLPYGAPDYTPYIVKAKDAGCKALAVNPIEPDAIGQVKAANAQGWDDVTWLYLTSVYSDNFAKAISDAGAGIYVPAEFYPFTEANDITADWQSLMAENDIPLTAFSQGGYLAATYFIDVLKGIEGDITRESVTKALHEMAPIENPMSGTPWVFGTAETHADQVAGWPIKLTSGTNKWELSGDDWLRIPSN